MPQHGFRKKKAGRAGMPAGTYMGTSPTATSGEEKVDAVVATLAPGATIAARHSTTRQTAAVLHWGWTIACCVTLYFLYSNWSATRRGIVGLFAE